MSEGVPLDLSFAKREGFVDDAMARCHLGHSNHKIIRVFDSQRRKEKV